MKLIALAIFLGAVVIAAAMILTNRHTLEMAGEGLRFDDLTN